MYAEKFENYSKKFRKIFSRVEASTPWARKRGRAVDSAAGRRGKNEKKIVETVSTDHRAAILAAKFLKNESRHRRQFENIHEDRQRTNQYHFGKSSE